ncbi:LysR substrate-binding domain-containing protein [Actinomadura viridis]|uniref:LysR substrate-binding domain-containing protein n=1 Tax=Actinomadura viridis TaxID=58110 RepID=UPI0036953F38
MNLVGHLRCFVVVAEELHFGHAAERLGMAQPPLSQRIQRLEKELGVRLFDRSSRRVTLTAPGRLLLAEAREFIARADRIYALAERAREGGAGTLRAGLPSGLGGAVVAAIIAAFRDRRPDLRLDLRELPTDEQARALADGTLDVGVLRHPCDTRDLALGPMLGQPVGVLLPRPDPVPDPLPDPAPGPVAGDDETVPGDVPVPDGAGLGGSAPVHLADLADRELVIFPREQAPGSYDELLVTCRRHGYDPPAVHQTADPQFALGLVLAGTAVALTPRTADTAGVVWRPLAGGPLVWRTSCAWRRAGEPDRAVAEFTAAATAVLRREAGMAPLDRSPARRVVPRPASGFLA